MARRQRHRKTFKWIAPDPLMQAFGGNTQTPVILIDGDRSLAGSTFTRLRGDITLHGLIQDPATLHPFIMAIYRAEEYSAGIETLDILNAEDLGNEDVLWTASGSLSQEEPRQRFELDLKAQRVWAEEENLMLTIAFDPTAPEGNVNVTGAFRTLWRIA